MRSASESRELGLPFVSHSSTSAHFHIDFPPRMRGGGRMPLVTQASTVLGEQQISTHRRGMSTHVGTVNRENDIVTSQRRCGGTAWRLGSAAIPPLAR